MPTLVVLGIFGVLIIVGWLTDRSARRRRKGLTSLVGPSSHPDRVAEVERMAGPVQYTNDVNYLNPGI